MPQETQVQDLEDLLDELTQAEQDSDRVSIDAALEAVGRRSFGPILLICGLFVISPLGAVPGAPSIVGAVVVLTAGQILIGRNKFWLPQFLLKRSVSREHFEKAVRVMRPVARFVDRLIRPRLKFMTRHAAVRAIAAVSILLALTSPFLEIIPWSITAVGAAWCAFGLALVADDGVVASIALAISVAVAGLIVWYMFF